MTGLIQFAIGDVHGEASKLAVLHEAILDHIAFEKLPARIIHLGDYVDRGPDSRGVIERVMALEARFEASMTIEVISLMGNHEQMMLKAYDSADDGGTWWSQGGAEAAGSYASDGLAGANWRETVPREHIAWLRQLKSVFRDQARRMVFVHAGIDPVAFPECSDGVRLWTRSSSFFDRERWPQRAALQDLLVIHGHTPRSHAPEIFSHRINIDTGACFGGPLTAVVLKDGEQPSFIYAGG